MLRFQQILADLLLRTPYRTRQREARVHVTAHRQDVVLLRAGQFILCGDDFDVIGDTGLKAVLSQIEFALREIPSFLRDRDLLLGGFQVQQGFANVP